MVQRLRFSIGVPVHLIELRWQCGRYGRDRYKTPRRALTPKGAHVVGAALVARGDRTMRRSSSRSKLRPTPCTGSTNSWTAKTSASLPSPAARSSIEPSASRRQPGGPGGREGSRLNKPSRVRDRRILTGFPRVSHFR
jgi:hypothetical protein